MKKLIIGILSASLLTSGAVLPAGAADDKTETISYTYSAGEGKTYTREMEKLGRGLVAIKSGSDVYLSWRLLDSEDNIFGSADSDVSFNVYKGSEKIAEVSDKTNYTVSGGDINASYSVAPVVDGVEGKKESAIRNMSNNYFDIDISKYKPESLSLPRTVSLKPSGSNSSYNYFVNTDAPENIPNGSSYDTYAEYVVSGWRDSTAAWKYYDYTINDCSVGDLDGDGEYEIIVKWDCNGQDNSLSGLTGPVYLDAYNLDGEQLWRIDLGRNIRAGAHYTQFLVYDFDLDGKAELACKTAPGSKDSTGAYVTAASHISSIRNVSDEINQTDYVNDAGRVLDGAEYYTIFDCNGKAVDTIEYPNLRGNISRWGNNESYGNRVDRFLGTVAYIDGVRPYMISLRGYYDKTTVAAIKYENGELSVAKNFVAESGTENAGQGNHNMTVADVDNDGKDEFMTGSICWDDDLSVLWNGKRGHGDALHIGDYDPTHNGFEYFTVQEASPYGMTVYDPLTGETLFHEDASADTGRGVMANIGMGGYYQIWSAKNGLQISNGETSYTAGNKNGLSQNFRIFWDGDLYDELLDGTSITSWNGSGIRTIFTASDCTSINGTKANPALQADIFGDWREEVIYPTSDNNALRIFSTTTPSDYKIKTLMHDPVYRSGVATEQTGYNQPPHVGMYMSMSGPVTSISAVPSKTTYSVGENMNKSDITVTATHKSGDTSDITDFEISGYNPLTTGTQTITVLSGGKSAAFNVNVTTGFTVNSDGYITGYSGASSAVLPTIINGTEIKGIDAGALKSNGLSRLTVYDDIDIASGALPSGITLVCFENSAAHKYAVANSVKYELMKPVKYFTNVTFEEKEYANVTDIATGTTDVTIGGITYYPGKRTDRGNTSNAAAISKETQNGSSVVKITATRFANNGRNASMTLNNLPSLAADGSYEFSMDFYIQDNSKGLSIVLLDESGATITTLKNDSYNISPNEWYHLTLTYNGGACTQFITNADGDIISSGALQYKANKPVKTINIPVSSQVNETNYVYLDNITSSTPITSELTLHITDSDGIDVPGASVTIGGTEKTTDADGNVTFSLEGGAYDAVISHDRLGSCTKTVTAYAETQTKTIALDSHFPYEPVAKPVIMVTELAVGCRVSIFCATPGATIRYITTDNDDVPDVHSTEYISPFMVYESTTVKAVAMLDKHENSDIAIEPITIVSPHVATPEISIVTTDSGKEVDIGTATEGASIYYTTDGTAPTTASTPFTDTITITETTTVKAIAVKQNYENSIVASAKITYDKAAAPTADTAAGSVAYGTLVSLSSSTDGADIYYTTDGSEPTTASKKYTGSIAVTADTTIKAIAVKRGYKASDTFTAAYTVTGEAPADKITLSVGSATSSGGMVSIPVYASFDSGEIDTRSYSICLNYDKSALEYVSVTPRAYYETVYGYDYEGEVELRYNDVFNSGLLFTVNLKVKDGAAGGTYPVTINMEDTDIRTYGNYDIEASNGSVTLIGTNEKIDTSITLTDQNGNNVTTGSAVEEITATTVVDDTTITDNDDEYYTPKDVILAVYDTNGALLAVSASVMYLNSSIALSQTVKIPEGANVGSAKLFIWDELSGMTPLCAATPLPENN